MLAEEHCTDRELEALRLRAKGASYREGGTQLGITKQAFHRRLKRAATRMNINKQPRQVDDRPHRLGGEHAR
jgi:predicted DNA-binding protein (UPF0251 family)